MVPKVNLTAKPGGDCWEYHVQPNVTRLGCIRLQSNLVASWLPGKKCCFYILLNVKTANISYSWMTVISMTVATCKTVDVTCKNVHTVYYGDCSRLQSLSYRSSLHTLFTH